jgi:hypothetical protein
MRPTHLPSSTPWLRSRAVGLPACRSAEGGGGLLTSIYESAIIKAANAVEFEGRLEGGRIEIPPEVACQLREGSEVRVIVLFDGEEDWRRLSAAGLSAAYADEDVVYESLMNAPPSR